MTNGTPVTRDVFDVTMSAVERRLGVNEDRLEALRGAEQEHRAIEDRLAVLEQAGKSEQATESGRRDRLWLIVIGLMTGIVCPLIVTSVITWLHLKSLKG
jgi:hypothetical protein